MTSFDLFQNTRLFSHFFAHHYPAISPPGKLWKSQWMTGARTAEISPKQSIPGSRTVIRYQLAH